MGVVLLRYIIQIHVAVLRSPSRVEREEEMPEGGFCYVFETGYFNLPQREMTDEELLQIIDFNMLRNYVLSQTPAGQEARREQLLSRIIGASKAQRTRLEECPCTLGILPGMI